VVIFENLSVTSNEYESIQDSSLVWVIVAAGKKGSKIADISWCKENLKQLVQAYASDILKFKSKKLTWKFNKNPETEKSRLLWYILYKVYTRLTKHNLNIDQTDNVSFM